MSPQAPASVAKPHALACPNCGGPVERRGFGYAMTVVCPQCLTVLDASTPLLQVLQKIEAEQSRRTPLIPLGSRGNMNGATWEVIGFQTRAVIEDGETFEWEEYLLFNPYKGFRYLTQYDGHWNFVTPLEAMPQSPNQRGLFPVFYDNLVYKHFSGGDATTTFVLGEFPWRAKVGDQVVAQDYVNPPWVLSSEATNQEITWSRGEYMPGSAIWKAFQLPGSAPPAHGVYLNQPSPMGDKVGGIWTNFAIMLALLLGLAIFFAVFSRRETVFRSSYSFASGQQGEPSFVTGDFDLTGRPASVEVAVNTNLDNNWTYFNFALVNEDSGQAYDFGREVSYYHGADSDGSWDEGSRTASAIIPAVTPGKYYLRVEPEMDSGSVSYDLTLRHDVPNYSWFWLAAGLLLLPPIIYTIRARSFETQRWMNSDHPPVRT
ncbi:MAG TPA: DUF4178 domain-containing protein [Bryobacteraceae bacterium]